MSDLPPALRLAWWASAWFAGRVGPDDLLDAVLGHEVAHVVVDPHRLANATGTASTELVAALIAARNAGAHTAGAAFPTAGYPVGMRGPRALTEEATEAGSAVLLLGSPWAWVPRHVGPVVEWSVQRAERRPPPDLGEADRHLRATLLASANLLADLDVAHWRPEVADELHDLRGSLEVDPPRSVHPRAVDLAGRAIHLQAVVDLALSDDGGALSVNAAEARREAIEPLRRAVAFALTAAGSPDGWPPAEDGPGDRYP